MARLRIEFRGAETVVSLAHGETTVGRSNRCTIHLPDPKLAPIHFRIRERSKGYQLKDDGSGIGTHVNGKPVFATTLRHGDLIEAGTLRCRFLERADAPAPPPAVPAVPPPLPTAPLARPPGGRTKTIWVAAAAGALVCLLVVFLLLSGTKEKEAEEIWREANGALEASRTEPDRAEEHLRRAAELLERVGAAYRGTRVASMAAMALTDTRRTLDAFGSVDEESRRLGAELTPEEAQDAFLRLARLKQGAHPAVVERVGRLEEELKQARTARAERLFAAAKKRADGLLDERKFGAALGVWRAFETPDYHYRKRADSEQAAVAKRIAKEYRALLKLASRGAELDGRIGLLEASRDLFSDTAHGEDLEVRISALRARRSQRRVVVIDEPRKEAPERPAGAADGPPAAEPEELPPYEEPPKVKELVRQRRYAEAAAMLHSITRHPDAKVRVEELTLLAGLMADLVAAVSARPGDFPGILLPHGVGRGDATGADRKFLEISKEGVQTRYAWESLPAKSFLRLFRLASLQKPPRLAVALFFDEEMQVKEAQRAYVAFFKSGQAPETLARILARRRGIERPRDGFQLFRGQLVTEPEKQEALLAERIEKLARQARSTLDPRRRGAWAELEKLGEPAVETLALVLKERRRQVAAELARSKTFSPARFVARLGNDLRQRREQALAFILDPNRYPYPNKSEAAQKEAERLVDLVREIYERPYAPLLEKSDAARALDGELKELDGRIARADPLDSPVHETTVDAIVKALDVAKIALDERDRKRIAYNVAVAKYNRERKTTADAEERANVVAVNEYRAMMGLHALKIDERLVRAARKHSIEMRQRKYFAHDSPTPHLRKPNHRAKREGYGGGVSENIARGASTGVQVFWQWFRSSGHHRNMLIRGHTEMGCGASAHHWWTQMFGRATGRRLDPPKVPPDPDPPGQSGNGDPAPEGP